MRFSTIRTGLVASAAAIALAACGGHGLVPSQSAAPGSSAVIPTSTNPCYTKAIQPTWIFKGSCAITTLPAKGKKIALAAYKNVTVTVAIPKNNAPKGTKFILVDAIGGKAKDVAPFKGKAFPPIPKSSGKSVIYVQAVNTFNGLKFSSGNLILTVTGKLPGTACSMALLQTNGKWLPIPIPASVSGSTITEKIPAGAVGTLFPNGLPQGPLFFNAACK